QEKIAEGYLLSTTDSTITLSPLASAGSGVPSQTTYSIDEVLFIEYLSVKRARRKLRNSLIGIPIGIGGLVGTFFAFISKGLGAASWLNIGIVYGSVALSASFVLVLVIAILVIYKSKRRRRIVPKVNGQFQWP
ncbi:MAG: hypothetical protein AAGM67_16445, partial [Bacteroidota bacterium]